MPRFVVKRKGRLKTSVRAERSAIKRVRRSRYVDPFPWIQGTVPEKMVYAELSRRGIKFAFQNEVRFRLGDAFNKLYRPDIILPQQKIIIEVQGAYWHSMDDRIESDAFKFAVYQTLGWKVLAWWDYDILQNLQALFASEPALAHRNPSGGERRSTEYVYTNKVTRDDTRGIATLNRKNALRKAYKRPAVRRRLG